MNETTIAGAEPVAGDGADDPPILFLHGIDRHYRQGDVTLEILKGVEPAVWPGQSVALVAPSGAGKSTLLHIAGIARAGGRRRSLYRPGRDLGALRCRAHRIRRTEIGFVYQFHHLLMEFSAIENVILPQMIRGLARKEAVTRATDLLAISGSRSA